MSGTGILLQKYFVLPKRSEFICPFRESNVFPLLVFAWVSITPLGERDNLYLSSLGNEREWS